MASFFIIENGGSLTLEDPLESKAAFAASESSCFTENYATCEKLV